MVCGVDFSPKYTLEVEKGEERSKIDKTWGEPKKKKSLFPSLQTASEKEKGDCTLMEKNQPLWLHVTYFLLIQKNGGGAKGCVFTND